MAFIGYNFFVFAVWAFCYLVVQEFHSFAVLAKKGGGQFAVIAKCCADFFQVFPRQPVPFIAAREVGVGLRRSELVLVLSECLV